MNYDELVKRLRNCSSDTVEDCVGCPYQGGYKGTYCMNGLISEAADAIKELFKAAKSMHTWIFLNTVDEQKAYDECGLSDEMNAMLGYGGQFEIKVDPCADCVHYPPSSTDGKPCCACDPDDPLMSCRDEKEDEV